MPVYKINDRQPKQPPWGEIPLEVYFLSEWEKPHPDPSQSNESPADRRKRLVRQFLALGFEGRQVYTSYHTECEDHTPRLTPSQYHPDSLTARNRHPFQLKVK